MGRKAHGASIQAVKDNQRALTRAITKGWTMASRAPMYCKTTEIPQPNKDGKAQPPTIKRRSARLINGDAYRIAASGAAQAASLFHMRELERYGMSVQNESVTTPWAPSVAPGARMMLEQFLVAYAQHAGRIAKEVMKGCKKHQRLNKQIIDLAFNLMASQVWQDRAPAGRKVVCLPYKAKKYVAPGASKVKAPEAEAYEPDPAEDVDVEAEVEADEDDAAEGQ